jgi:hypothetical protein
VCCEKAILANKAWSWDENPLPVAIDDESGKVGFFIEWFISVERAIASAWLRRGQNSNWTIHRRPGTEDRPPKASNLAWTQMEMEEEENEPLPGEIFKPMRGSYKFFIGAVPVNPMYEISNKGRLRSPFTGKITRGWVFNHTRIASVKGAGLLDLLIASRIKPNVKYLPPAVKLAVDCLGSGCSPLDLARYQGVALSTAWTKFCVAQKFVDLDLLMKYVPQLVSRDLWVVLRNMQQSGDHSRSTLPKDALSTPRGSRSVTHTSNLLSGWKRPRSKSQGSRVGRGAVAGGCTSQVRRRGVHQRATP